MNSRSILHFFLLCAALGALAGVAGVWVREQISRPDAVKWKLETPVHYSEEMQNKMESCALWRRKKAQIVENQEFRRQTRASVYRIAGNSAALFPDANGLRADDAGKCLLGNKTAYVLFGSTDVAGRKVQVGGTEYIVAGVEFQEEEACVCEVKPDAGEKLTHAAVLCDDAEKAWQYKQEINAWN